jgi:hypothetical protein
MHRMLARRLTIIGLVPWLFGDGLLRGQVPVTDTQSPVPFADRLVSAKLHPALVRLAEGSDEPVKAWVFLADKGIRSEPQYQDALRQVERTYNRRAIWRRAVRADNARRGGALFDERDLPVVEAYVDAVAATGARVQVTSRWVNAVSVWAGRQQLEAISGLPFVRALQPVARGRRIDDGLDVQELGSGQPPEAGEGSPRGGLPNYGLATEQLSQINLIALHQAGATGSGVVIGVLDTGFRRDHVAFNHPDKPLTVLAEYDFLDGDFNTDIEPGDPSAQHFHGTSILGTMASYAPGDLIGGAYDASFILCKTEDTTAEYPAEEDNYVAGLEFIEANGGQRRALLYVGGQRRERCRSDDLTSASAWRRVAGGDLRGSRQHRRHRVLQRGWTHSRRSGQAGSVGPRRGHFHDLGQRCYQLQQSGRDVDVSATGGWRGSLFGPGPSGMDG